MSPVKILYFLLLFVPVSIPAQSYIHGYLYEADLQTPIPFATVYINGSTAGAVTDETGFFRLLVEQVPAQLIASHLGYNRGLWDVNAIPQDTIAIQLKPNVRQLETVEVQDQDQRLKNLEEFRLAFLGDNHKPKKVSLLNESALFFERDYRSSGRPINLKARSSKTLRIEQGETGYTIYVDLVQFVKEYWDGYRDNGTSWLAYYYFEPWEDDNKRKQKKYRAERDRLYYNSAQHFLKALYEEELPNQGYQVLKPTKDSLSGKTNYEPFDLSAHLVTIDAETKSIRGLEGTILRILYYDKNDGRPIPLPAGKGRNPVSSLIQFDADDCLFRANGTTPGTTIRFGGVIGNKKVAAMLPNSYLPEQEEN